MRVRPGPTGRLFLLTWSLCGCQQPTSSDHPLRELRDDLSARERTLDALQERADRAADRLSGLKGTNAERRLSLQSLQKSVEAQTEAIERLSGALAAVDHRLATLGQKLSETAVGEVRPELSPPPPAVVVHEAIPKSPPPSVAVRESPPPPPVASESTSDASEVVASEPDESSGESPGSGTSTGTLAQEMETATETEREITTPQTGHESEVGNAESPAVSEVSPTPASAPAPVPPRSEKGESARRALGFGLLLVGVLVIACTVVFLLRRRQTAEEPDELDALEPPVEYDEEEYDDEGEMAEESWPETETAPIGAEPSGDDSMNSFFDDVPDDDEEPLATQAIPIFDAPDDSVRKKAFKKPRGRK